MPKRPQDIPQDGIDHLSELARAIGERVKQRRRKLKLTQEMVRARMELESVYVTRTQFSRVEKGTRLPNAAEVIALANVLGVSCNWILLGM